MSLLSNHSETEDIVLSLELKLESNIIGIQETRTQRRVKTK